MSDTDGQESLVSAAVASGTSMGDTSRLQRGERLALAVRILATAGALLFAVGAWMPWVVVTGYSYVGTGDQRQSYTLALSLGDAQGIFGSFGGSALTVVGLLLVPLLWWHWRSLPWVSPLIFALYVIWTSLLSTLLNEASIIMPRLISPSAPSFGSVALVPELGHSTLTITHYGSPLPGYWVAGLAIVLLPIGSTLSLISALRQAWGLRRKQALPAAPASHPRVALPGASALTIGLALWAVSTFVMPWASVNCSATPLFFGTCTGLPYNAALRFGIADATTLIDPMVAQYAVGVLLGGGAAIILAGLWLRARSLAFCGWTTLWLVLAASFAWLAEDGVGVVVEKHAALGLQAGVWVGENAVLVTLLGFILVIGGLAHLWVDALRNRRTPTIAL